ncbi:FxSxx-COOH system tetratricopeptide repeat protein [Tengunoibacter tsumagoiensis]|uniref:Tetratricopeptide repeat protein n=1 Tax=Tengunoibacter tsumagoiensis TaxID=2014871 RepID=A0A402A7Q0_9CHLR|nr:FxSxx-COOH system tetratricopeptide repeat protein [Tengunoibacter tsumagoiensis]GCE15197.1 tetratricopeptide repeat protein [Tengunoibacter tsumagoiensis]
MPKNERLQQERIRRNWRQHDVADQLGINNVTVQRWERGTQQPGAYYRAKLCELFKLSSQELGLITMYASEDETSAVLQPEDTQPEETAIWTVPYARNPHFTGRETFFELLEHQFSLQKPDSPPGIRQVALTQAQVIKGLGGIGKTQIAVEYAYRAREQGRYTHTLWINAGSLETILASFVALAELLPIGLSWKETDQRTLVAEVLRWLERCDRPWLLIFDNADDLSFGHSFLPVRGNGNIVLTTRSSAVGSLTSSIEVNTMEVMEGVQFLLRRAQHTISANANKIEEATNIVIALAQFPLAIDQAGAYIEETGCSLQDYFQIYHQRRYELLARRGKHMGYPESVATTWSLSFQRVEEIHPQARELLRLCAFLAPDDIPEELLIDGASYWPPALQQAVANHWHFNLMLEALQAFSLIKRVGRERQLSLHRLIQVVQRDLIAPDERRQWAERVVQAVHTLFPRHLRDVSSWPTCRRYLGQVEECAVLIRQYRLRFPEAAELLNRAGLYYMEHGFYQAARPFFEQALSLHEESEGAHPLSLARNLNNLAVLYLRQGKYQQAEPLFQRALQIRRQPGEIPQNDIAQSLHNLALLYSYQGKYQQAETFFQHALSIAEQVFGEEHEKTAICLQNLAKVYRMLGRYEQAEPLYQRALTLLEKQSGPDHPLVAYPLGGLANLAVERGTYEQAEALYRRALDILEHQLRPDHPYIADSYRGLGNLCAERGDHEQARRWYRQALILLKQQFGQDTPLAAPVLIRLATLQAEQKNDEQAKLLFQQALHLNEQAFGAESPSLIEPLLGLATIATAQGCFDQAGQLYQQAQAILEQHLDPEHPFAARILEGLADLVRKQGFQQREKILLTQAL